MTKKRVGKKIEPWNFQLSSLETYFTVLVGVMTQIFKENQLVHLSPPPP